MKRILVLITAVFTASLWLLPAQTNRQETIHHGPQSRTEQALINLEQEWAGAVKLRDTEKINRLQAEEYIFTDPAGQIWTNKYPGPINGIAPIPPRFNFLRPVYLAAMACILMAFSPDIAPQFVYFQF